MPFLRINCHRKPRGAQIIHHVFFATGLKGVLISTPLKPQTKIGEDSILLPQQERASINTVNPTMYPPRYEMRMMVQELCRLYEPKVNKLKGGYCAMENLIFKSWLNDIKAHVEDQNLWK